MVKVGVIGPGPLWETRYLPALRRLTGKIAVRAVYDAVAVRAEQVASEWKALPVQGISALADMSAVQAILLIDAGWAGPHALELACGTEKPVYIAGTLGADVELLQRLRTKAAAAELTLMPEFTLRNTPATARLQELMATKLGRPRRITLDAAPPAPNDPAASISGTGADFLVGLFDWCRYVLRTSPARVEAKPGPVESASDDARSPPHPGRIEIEFARTKSGVEPRVEIALHEKVSGPARKSDVPATHDVSVRQEVECEHGRATLRSATEICWQVDGAEPQEETLTTDRAAVEVMLDHFLRRVVGGLIPVADIGDVCRGVALARAVEESLRAGTPIELVANGP